MSALEDWLIARIAQDAGLPGNAVDAVTPVYRFGIDSRTLAFILENAEREFGVLADLDRISPAETIRALAEAMTLGD
jgi:hypothetical protein